MRSKSSSRKSLSREAPTSHLEQKFVPGDYHSWRKATMGSILMLAAFGGFLGVALAAFSLGPLLQLIPAGASVPFLDNVALDAGVLAFTFMLTMLTGVLFGLVPARKAASSNLNDALRLGGRSKPHGSQRLGNALVVAEVTTGAHVARGRGARDPEFSQFARISPGLRRRASSHDTQLLAWRHVS